MYFSVITPAEGRIAQAAHELAKTPYSEHQWIWKFFPSEIDATRDFIFRRHEHEQMLRFYVVSLRAPTAFSQAWQVQTRSYEPNLQEGQRLSFELLANPVISKKDDTGKSRRHDVVMQAKKQLLKENGFATGAKWADWIDEKKKPLLYDLVQERCTSWFNAVAERNGFKIATADEESYRLILQIDAYEKKQVHRREERINFSTANFTGELIVTQPELFSSALYNGVGHAKVFGCGLLLVKKV
jgi:CRISPR system Cascade subunit CasE